MSRIEWESEKGRSLRDRGAAVVCRHPMHFMGSEDDLERDCEDHDGFFEPWSHGKLEISPTNTLEITVGFLAVKNSNIPGKRIFELPDKLLSSWDLTENKILIWANSWWNLGKKESANCIPKFVLYAKPADQILSDEEMVANIKENCRLVVELTEESGSVTGRFGYSTFSEERAQLMLNLKDRKEEYRRHTVVHEFGHILGLKHEHQRSDFWRGIYRFTDFNTIRWEQFSERKETKGVYDDYTTYDSLSVMHYFWRLEYLKKQYRQWFESQLTTVKLEIAKKRLNLEISATEEMVLMGMCDQLHKVKTLKYFIESKGVSNNEWVLGTQLEPRDVPLPTKQEDIPERGVKAWIKLASGRLKPVTICKVEYVAGSVDSESHHINDAYKFVVKPSTKDIKLVNWAYNTSENKLPRPYSVPKPPPPVIQPTASGKGLFKIHLDPFDESYGGLGDFKVIVICGNPVKYNLAPTKTQIPDKALPKNKGQSKTHERVFVVHTEDASKMLMANDFEVATPSVKPDDDDCYYIFIRLYAPDGKVPVFRDSATVPLLELKSAEKARVCYENLKKRAKSEIEVAMFAPQAILSDSEARNQLKKQVLELLEENVELPEIWMEKYQLGPLNDTFLQQLDKVMEFLFLFRGRNDLPFQLIKKIGLISSDLKSDIALYKAACEVEKLKAVEIAYKEHHIVAFDHEVSSDNIDGPGPTHFWRFSCDESFTRAIPAEYSKLRVSIKCKENRYLFEMLLKFGRTLSSGKQFYAHEMYMTDQEASNLHVIFLVPLVEHKDMKKAFRGKVQPKFINEIGIMKVVQISHENKETVLYSHGIQTDAARYRKRARKVPADSEQEGMLSLLSSMKMHSLGKTRASRVQADSGDESSMGLVLKHAPNWKVVAKDLGFSDKRVERIESDYLLPERCLRVTIWKWLHNNKWKTDDKVPKPTVDNLKTVMENISLA